jgi:hypothetical protein
MSRRIKLLVAAATLSLVMAFASALPVLAANAPAGCEKVRGTIVCQQSGKNENQEKFQQTTTKKGSLQSSHDPETECGTPCPRGQFKDEPLAQKAPRRRAGVLSSLGPSLLPYSPDCVDRRRCLVRLDQPDAGCLLQVQ